MGGRRREWLAAPATGARCGGPEVRPLVSAGKPRLPADPRLARMRWISMVRGAGLDPGRYLGEWNPDAPTPWEHIESAFPRDALRAAYMTTRRRLGLS